MVCIHILALAFFFSQRIQRLVRLRQRLLCSTHICSVGVDVVDQAPVPGSALRCKAVRIDRCAHRPRMLIQRKVAVHDTDLVLVTLHQRREQLCMHLRAERALQVVKPHNYDWSIRRAATSRPAGSAYQLLRILADIELA